MLGRLRARDSSAQRLFAVVVALSLVAIPLVVSGPGNDLDVRNVFRSGRSIARDWSYLPSRAPGSPVHEALVGVLDRLGGPLLTNLASLAAAIALLVGLDRLLRREGVGPTGRWAVALVAANPWFVIAATSTADYVFALLFVVSAALALRSGRPVTAGVLAAASMGSRVGSGALLVAMFAAELTEAHTDAEPTDPRPAGGGATRRVYTAAAVTGALTVLLFVPAYLSAGGLSFAENDFSTSRPIVQLGRALVKDLTLLGPVASLVLLAAVPALVAALRRWRTSWLVRFAAVGLVLSQVLFVRFPWKLPHLLPTLVCLAILLAVALEDRARLLVALVVLQLLSCVVRVDVIRPDNPNEATGGRPTLGVGWGPVVTDWQCRREHPRAYLGRQKVEVEAAWDCAKPFGG